MFFKYFSLVILAVLFMAAVALIVFLGSLPAKIARSRNHPQVDAINAISWLGIFLTCGIGWGIALVWALYRYDAPRARDVSGSEVESLTARTRHLESKLAVLEKSLAQSNVDAARGN